MIEAEIFPDHEYAKKKRISDIRKALQEIIDAYNQGAPAYKKIYGLKQLGSSCPTESLRMFQLKFVLMTGAHSVIP